ncbi:MAG: hypothetical protein SFV17_12810 [Candidatus Obscuribacter sp.]|nr:hypothetical protein [Candidatus Obscuribacter sp.]
MSDRPERNNQASQIDEYERARVLMLQDSVYQPPRDNQSKPSEPIKAPPDTDSVPARGADAMPAKAVDAQLDRARPGYSSEQSTTNPVDPQESGNSSKQNKYLPGLEIK